MAARKTWKQDERVGYMKGIIRGTLHAVGFFMIFVSLLLAREG